MYSKLPHIDYLNLSPKDIKEVQERAHAAEISFQTQRKAEVRQELATLAASRGFPDILDLYPELRGKKQARKKSSVAIKFQNPDNSSDTWTGRGRKPNWLVAKIKQGDTLENFELRVRKPVATISKKPVKQRGGKGGTRPKKLFVCRTDPTKTWGGYGHKPNWYEPGQPNVYGQVQAA